MSDLSFWLRNVIWSITPEEKHSVWVTEKSQNRWEWPVRSVTNKETFDRTSQSKIIEWCEIRALLNHNSPSREPRLDDCHNFACSLCLFCCCHIVFFSFFSWHATICQAVVPEGNKSSLFWRDWANKSWSITQIELPESG